MLTVVAIENWGIPDAFPKGQYAGGNLYSSHTGDMCCLGFAATQGGLTNKQCDGLAYPNSVCSNYARRIKDDEFPGVLKPFGEPGGHTTLLARAAASINDSERVGWLAKMDLLTCLFQVADQQIVFTFNGHALPPAGQLHAGQVKAINTFLKRKREKRARELKRAAAAVECMEGVCF